MIKNLLSFAKRYKIEIYASLEERMACGIGACVCCTVNTKEGIKKVCKDGPVFNGIVLGDNL